MFTKLLVLHAFFPMTITFFTINYWTRGSCLEVANLLARHFAFILVLIALQCLSFSNGELFGNLVNNKILRLFSLVASRDPFPYLPSVLQLANSSLLKKKGSNFKAHLWISWALSNVCLRACTFLGLTHVWISPSLTTSSVSVRALGGGVCGSQGTLFWGSCSGVLAVSSQKCLKASTSIVGKASASRHDVSVTSGAS